MLYSTIDMKKVLFLLPVVLLLVSCSSSEDYTGLDFMGIEMKGSPEEFAQKLVDSGNFYLVSQDDYSIQLSGDYYGFEADVNIPTDYTCVKLAKVRMEGGVEMADVFMAFHNVFPNEYGESEGWSVFENGMMVERWETELGQVAVIYMPADDILPTYSVTVDYDSKGDPTIEYETVTTY